MGRISKPSLPRSNTFNGPPFSNPSRRHHSNGKTVWRLLVRVMVIVFIMVSLYYPKNALCKVFCPDFGGIILCSCLRKAVGIFCQALPLTVKNMKQKAASGVGRKKGNFRHHEIRGPRRQCGQVALNHFYRCKDLLPAKLELSGVLPELAGKILCNPCNKLPEISVRIVI